MSDFLDQPLAGVIGGKSAKALADTLDDQVWATALRALVADGRARKVEVRKVDGAPLDLASPLADVLRRAGFADSYRGLVVHG